MEAMVVESHPPDADATALCRIANSRNEDTSMGHDTFYIRTKINT